MKKTHTLIALLLCLISAQGCKTKVNCINQTQYVVVCNLNRQVNDSTDTLVNIVAYQKNTDFGKPVDTFYNVHAGADYERVIVWLDKTQPKCDQFDWKFFFYKTGDVFTLKSITHVYKTEKQFGDDLYVCANDLNVVANDSFCHIAGQDGQFATEAIIDMYKK